jgi:hypothetical protein
MHATCPTYLILLDLINLIKFCEQYKLRSSLSCSFFPQSPAISTVLGPIILLSILFSYIIKTYYFLNVRDQVSHSHRARGKLTVLYILIFKLLGRRLENKI